jgi:hypothetical protein
MAGRKVHPISRNRVPGARAERGGSGAARTISGSAAGCSLAASSMASAKVFTTVNTLLYGRIRRSAALSLNRSAMLVGAS